MTGRYFNPLARIHINPGTGPVIAEEITESHAMKNMAAFITDVLDAYPDYNDRIAWWINPIEPDEGRWTFIVEITGGAQIEVLMPGAPLDEVRYLAEPNQDPWDYPRLYVDGSSWLWCFAIGQFEPDLRDGG
jgi:hypothetical protein